MKRRGQTRKSGRWGQTIRGLRKERGIGQRELARMAEIDRSSLLRLEAGTSDGRITLVEALLRGMGLKLQVVPINEGRR